MGNGLRLHGVILLRLIATIPDRVGQAGEPDWSATQAVDVVGGGQRADGRLNYAAATAGVPMPNGSFIVIMALQDPNEWRINGS